jgi:hypothetical protein
MNENLNENEMENISQNQPEADLPQNSVETPAESMVEPIETPAEETVAEVLVEEAPAEEVVAEAPVNMVQEETSAEEMLAEAPSEEIAEEILVEENAATETVAVTEEVETIADDDEHGLADFAEAANDDADLESKTKKELLDEFYAVTKEGNPLDARARVNRLKNILLDRFNHERQQRLRAFIDLGNLAEDFDNVDPEKEKFDGALSHYRNRLQNERDQRERSRQLSKKQRENLIISMRQALTAEDPNEGINEFRRLQDEWRQMPSVPGVNAQELWDNYHALNEKFYDNLKINRELRDLDMQKNLRAKLDLCDQAESLIVHENMAEASRKLNELFAQWKEIGPVNPAQRQEIWDRFKSASDKIHDRRKEYIDQLEQARANNAALKTALCEAVEAIAANSEENKKNWKNATEQVEAIFEQWKKTGPAAKEENEALWVRFKGARNVFFNAKNDHFRSARQEQINNLNRKKELCVHAEALMDNNDWKNTTNEYLRLQAEWKKIGPVPREQSDEIWKRFRTSCDWFFQKKNEYFSSLDSVKAENYTKKLALMEEIKAFQVSENPGKDIDQLKAFQNTWFELGQVPQDKREALQNDYRALIDGHFSSIKMNQADKHRLQFQNRLESLKESGDGAMRKEEQVLRQKIDKISNDIALYENNIQFFANSKNIDALRAEVDKKIRVAQVEIGQLKDQLRMIREANKKDQ